MANAKYEKVKKDLKSFFDDWKILTKGDSFESIYVEKMAADIINLYNDAKDLLKDSHLKEDAELVIHLLSTPWGAPFVSKSTLIEAAKKFDITSVENSDLLHLLKDFVNYTYIFNNQIYCILEDLQDDIELEERNHEKI